MALDIEAQAVRARMFAGDIGIAEDPATGSAALALGVWLAASGLVPAEGDHGLTIEQGVEMDAAAPAACRHRGRRSGPLPRRGAGGPRGQRHDPRAGLIDAA